MSILADVDYLCCYMCMINVSWYVVGRSKCCGVNNGRKPVSILLYSVRPISVNNYSLVIILENKIYRFVYLA